MVTECIQSVPVTVITEKLKKNVERNVGEVMTILESSLTGENLVAMKRLIKQAIWRNYNSFKDQELGNSAPHKEGN